jgi:superfamily I DNA/RNA helicase
MTLHGAKGLEARNVIIAGLADQVMPGVPKDDPFEEELRRREQQRLLYVSVTRARNTLIVSWPTKMEYKDVASNQVRIDPNSIRIVNDKKTVALGACSLLPFSKQPIAGEDWLRRI